MLDTHKSLRLGDLLVEKGLITRPQLRQAIEIQQAQQSHTFNYKNTNAKTELGAILIELGFISRQQLQANLNWQRRLKATTAVMVFIAPLLTAACGGGAGASNSPSNANADTTSSQASTGVSPKSEPQLSSSSSSSSSAKTVSSSSSLPKAGSSSSLSSKSKSSSSMSSVSSSSSLGVVDGSVGLYWNVPTQRENGERLDITEIGGYELRYKLKSETAFKTIRISDAFIDAYYFKYLKGDYEFQIATFDIDGLYSNFVGVDPS
jgi:hypothetical protein